MYKTVSSLPPLEPSFGLVDLTESGKRQWETSKSGYVNWAVGRMLEKSDAEGRGVDKVENLASEIGREEDLKSARRAVGIVKDRLDTVIMGEAAKKK